MCMPLALIFVQSLCMPQLSMSFILKTSKPHAPLSFNSRAIPKSRSTDGYALKPLQTIKIKNPFGGDPDIVTSEPLLSAEDLFDKARTIIGSDFGLKDNSFFDDEFIWIGPDYNCNVLGKEEYLAALNFFDLRSTFPDLDYRAHDFRLDPANSLTVRLTARTVGTMRGNLRLRKEIIPPNGKRMVCPPEVISMTFDGSTGKLKKLCSGFCMDRLVGNTNGLCGVKAASTIAGKPPSELDIYPVYNVVQRFFGRPVKQLPDKESSFLAPFPESVMIQLAKGVIAANNGASDPDLLSSSFTFCGPLVGPIKKDEFVKAFGGFDVNGGFPDLDPEYSNFRVDPYDPYRVWVDVRATGTRTGTFAGADPTGLRYEGPSEVASFTFDDDGFCERLTAGAVIDPTQGNTGGLGGVFGIFYATGTPLPGIVTRTLPDNLSRLSKRILSPITKVGVDNIALPGELGLSSIASSVKIPKPPTLANPKVIPKTPKPPSQSISRKASFKPKPPVPKPPSLKPPKSIKLPRPTKLVPKVQQKPKITTKSPTNKLVSNEQKLGFLLKNSTTAAGKKQNKTRLKDFKEAKEKKMTLTAVAQAKQEKMAIIAKMQQEKKDAAEMAKKEKAASFVKKQEEKKEAVERARKEKATANAKLQQEKKEAAERARKEKAAMIAKMQQEKKEAALRAKKERDVSKKAIPNSLGQKKAKVIAKRAPPKAPPKIAAPKGVPKLSKWRKMLDRSVTGKVTGSEGFDDGDQITTSIIVSGEFKSGNVVVTESGSKYFLE